MSTNRLLTSTSTLPPHFSRHSIVKSKAGWLDRFIRFAGSVAVDHTHLLPLNTLEAELKARTGRRTGGQCG